MQVRFARMLGIALTVLIPACSSADDPATGEIDSASPEGQAQIQHSAGMVGAGPQSIDGGARAGSLGETPMGEEDPGRAPSAASASRSPDAAISARSQGPNSSGAAPAPVGTRANDILERAEQAYAQVRSMEADFTQAVYVPLLESTQRSRGKIFHRSPDRFLMRFSEPEGDIVVADGRYVWMYYPSTDPRQVMRGPLAEGGQQVDLQREFLSDAAARYDATRTGGETIGGRQTHALTLVPKGSSPYRQIRIWVDTQDHLVRRFEISEQNGTVRDLTMSNLRPNVTLSDAVFEFTPPPGAQVFEP